MKKEIDPKIQSAAASYAAQFSDGTTLTHFVAFYLGGGECFAVRPIAGENGATITRLKPLTAPQWRAMMLGRR